MTRTGPAEDEAPRGELAHLFRREAGRMVPALTRIFGIHNLGLAEDVVQDAVCRALEVWKSSGVPENPSAWLMAAAKNRAIDMLRRERTARMFAPDLAYLFDSDSALALTVEELFAPQEICDAELRMMFACCHGRIGEETQIALILNILSGFSVKEVAQAFLVSDSSMEKRLQRGKRALGELGSVAPASAARVKEHRGAVLRALYLLFNEGYHGSHPIETVRVELCAEAMRLGLLLTMHDATALPETRALLALMCLHAARLPGRADARGDLVPLAAQDRSRWDAGLIARGLALLDASASGDVLSEYHIEAAIAAEHATAKSVATTNWQRIVDLYDLLLQRQSSPVVALSRAIALGKLHGPEHALKEILRIDGRERLAAYPFYSAAIAEFYLDAGQPSTAAGYFREALAVARGSAEARFLEQRLLACASEAACVTLAVVPNGTPDY